MISPRGEIGYRCRGREIRLPFALGERSAGEGVVIDANPNGTRMAVLVRPQEEIVMEHLYLDLPVEVSHEDKIFVNGFQSWSHSREFSPGEKLKGLNFLVKRLLGPYGDYEMHPYLNGRLHSYTYTYLKSSDRFTLYGSVSEKHGYTVFEWAAGGKSMRIAKDCRGRKLTEDYPALDILIAHAPEAEAFAAYFAEMGGIGEAKPQTGWTSWYNYYTGITEGIILDNLNACARHKIPIDIFQIDDGYQEAVGDWLNCNGKFPRGMNYLADCIHRYGYRAGLWLAPFICEKKSQVYREHGEWLVRDRNGKAVRAGYNPGWSGIFHALDISRPEVRDYLKRVFEQVLNRWGYDMVKLDFLYAAALVPRPDQTRGEIMCQAMEFIRREVGSKAVLGCGVPLGSAFGMVEYCRIGSDVALVWEDKLLKRLRYRERVSTYNSLTSTIGRRQLNGRAFGNDPDVIILRSDNNRLTPAQRETLLFLNFIFGGLVFTSDNIDRYSPEEMDLYLSTFPFPARKIREVVGEEVVRVEFAVGEKEYLAFANLQGRPTGIAISPGLYFHKGEFVAGGETTLAAFSSLCLRRLNLQEFEFVGGDHIFPGCEAAGFRVDRDRIEVDFHPHSFCREFYIKVPSTCSGCTVNGEYLEARQLSGVKVLKGCRSRSAGE